MQVLDENIYLTVPLNSAQLLDKAVELLNTNIRKAAWASTRITYGKFKPRTNKHPPEVNELINKRRRSRTTWQQVRTPENQRILNSYCKELNLLIKKIKNEGSGKFLCTLPQNRVQNIHYRNALKTKDQRLIPRPLDIPLPRQTVG